MRHRLPRPLVLLLSIAALLLFPWSALAAGIGVAPGKMEFSIRPGSMATQTLYVINQSDQESLFQVYVEGEKEEWFKITPSEFILGPQATKSVEIGVAPPLTATESHDFSILVVSLPPDNDLRLGVGVKVAARVQLLEFPLMAIQWWLVIAALVVTGGIGLFFWRRRKAHHA